MASMHDLALFGWAVFAREDGSLARLLDRLERRASLRPVAVGDDSASRLVRARTATGLPCYQHLLEMARVTEYDAALINTPTFAAEIAERAAARGADLLVSGDRLDAEALSDVAISAVRHGVKLAVLRPALRDAGYAFLRGLIADDGGWAPRFVGLELSGDRDATALLRDAVSAALRLSQAAPLTVSASAAGSGEEPEVLVAQLRFREQALTSLTARPAPAERLRLSVKAHAGEVELESGQRGTQLALTVAGEAPENSRLPRSDIEDLEAVRVASIRSGAAADTLPAHHEAATLHAVERALASGRAEPVSAPTPRAALRVLEGGGRTPSTPRAGRLRLVGV